MRILKQWLIVNLFFLALYLGGVALCFLLGLLLDSSGLRGQAWAYASSALGVVSLVIVYRVGKAAHWRLDGLIRTKSTTP